MSRHLSRKLAAVTIAIAAVNGCVIAARAQSVVTIGIGTQDTTTNTVTAGIIIRQLHLLEKYLPTDGKYANVKFDIEWSNFTSGPPVTNAMMADKLQFGMMGDYPLMVNGFTFESNPGKQEPPDRGRGLQSVSDRATASWSTRTRPTTISPTSRASWSACRSVPPRTAWCSRRCRTAAGPPDYLPARQPEPGGRLDQSAGKEDRRARRLRAVRGVAAVPWLCPQDLRRRRDQPADLARRRGPHRLRREISRSRRRLHQGHHRRQRMVARRSQARRREDPGMDRHQQGGRLHLPRPGRQHDDRSDHQAAR